MQLHGVSVWHNLLGDSRTVLYLLSLFITNFISSIRGAASTGEDDFVPMWKEFCDNLKECLGSIVLPIGRLSVGLCRHRALLFKVCM